MSMACTRSDRPGYGKHSRRSFCLRLQPSLCAVLIGAVVWASASASAQDGIRRCIGDNGEPVFSDRPCTAVKVPADTDGFSRDILAATTTQTCATTADDLKDRVAMAFADRNAVALSGLLLWDGYRGREATSELQALARLVTEPLVAIDIDARIAEPVDTPEDRRRPSPVHALSIRTVRDLDHVPHEARTEFAIVDQGGCWWLRPGL